MKSTSSGGLLYLLGAAGVIGGLVLIQRDAAHGFERPVREGVLGGALVGAGIALLSLLEDPKLVDRQAAAA